MNEYKSIILGFNYEDGMPERREVTIKDYEDPERYKYGQLEFFEHEKMTFEDKLDYLMASVIGIANHVRAKREDEKTMSDWIGEVQASLERSQGKRNYYE